MDEAEIVLRLTRRQVSVTVASLGMVVAATGGNMSYETRVALEEICRQAGINAHSMIDPYKEAEEPKKTRRRWKR